MHIIINENTCHNINIHIFLEFYETRSEDRLPRLLFGSGLRPTGILWIGWLGQVTGRLAAGSDRVWVVRHNPFLSAGVHIWIAVLITFFSVGVGPTPLPSLCPGCRSLSLPASWSFDCGRLFRESLPPVEKLRARAMLSGGLGKGWKPFRLVQKALPYDMKLTSSSVSTASHNSDEE